jgi:hypothetical protein
MGGADVSRKAILIVLVAIAAAFSVSRLMHRAAAPATSATKAQAAEIQILPADAHTNSLLTARIAGSRGHTSQLASCAWYRNGELIAGMTEPTLDPSQFSKGDRIEVEASTAAGEPARRSQPVVIQDSRPQINSAMASQRDDRTEMFLRVNASDNDNDPLTYTYAWYRNGEEIAGATGETLDVSGFHDGDSVYARIIASDGSEDSVPFNSSPIVLGSEAPAFTSTPPSATIEGRYIYQVTTTHDPGTLSFELLQAPAGMTIDGNGRIEWQMPAEQDDVIVHEVAVRVSHPTGGEAVQRFKITTGPVTAAAR